MDCFDWDAVVVVVVVVILAAVDGSWRSSNALRIGFTS